MSKAIIEIRGISKKLRIRHETTPYLSFRERLGQLVRLKRHSTHEEFLALDDISFDVQAGDSLAIIGKNGAGKSTLLKILSRITPPTSGIITYRGRIASLLEVGTGFHPELSGRENIFLNGSILGMKRREIVSKLDEIIDFSGVERFLDTPLKHYSSGMQLRLAFSVAAFLEPEILIIDEVLAVGDAEFQRKCLNQMGKVTRSGRTILFVSHNLGAVRSLCNKAVLLDSGKVMMQGHTSEVVERYLTSSTPHKNRNSKKNLSSCGRIEMGLPSWLNSSGESVSRYQYGDNPCLQFELQFKENVQGIVFGIGVNTHDGVRIFTSHSIDDINFTQSEFPKGSCYIRTKLDLPSLAPGSYNIVYGISDKAGAVLLYSENEIQLEIESTQNVKDGANGLLWHTGSWALADKP